MTNMPSQRLSLTHFLEILLALEFQLINDSFSYEANFIPQYELMVCDMFFKTGLDISTSFPNVGFSTRIGDLIEVVFLMEL